MKELIEKIEALPKEKQQQLLKEIAKLLREMNATSKALLQDLQNLEKSEAK